MSYYDRFQVQLLYFQIGCPIISSSASVFPSRVSYYDRFQVHLLYFQTGCPIMKVFKLSFLYFQVGCPTVTFFKFSLCTKKKYFFIFFLAVRILLYLMHTHCHGYTVEKLNILYDTLLQGYYISILACFLQAWLMHALCIGKLKRGLHIHFQLLNWKNTLVLTLRIS